MTVEPRDRDDGWKLLRFAHLLKAFCSVRCGSRCWDSSEFLSHIRKIPQKHCDCSLQGGMTHQSCLMVLMLIKTEMRIVSRRGLTSVIQLKTEDFHTYNMSGVGLCHYLAQGQVRVQREVIIEGFTMHVWEISSRKQIFSSDHSLKMFMNLLSL